MPDNNYLKPQVPLNIQNDYFYPLTTDDQVIMSDGRRLNQLNLDKDDSPIVFIGSSENFPAKGDAGKIYIKNGYIYMWSGSSYRILGVQSVNNKTGQVELTAADVGALSHPTEVSSAHNGDHLIIQSISNGRIIVGFESSTAMTGGFIEFTEDSEVEERKSNTLYGKQLQVISDDTSTSSYSG